MKRTLIGLMALLVLVAIAAASALAATNPKTLVLNASEVGANFKLAYLKVDSNADAASRTKTSAATFKKWGRITGATSEIVNKDTATNGVLLVDSYSSLWKSAAGAHLDFLAGVNKANSVLSGSGGKKLSVMKLGNEIAAYELHQTTSTGVKLTAFLYAWRSGSVVDSLVVIGRDGTVQKNDAEILATQQNQHLLKR
jgi:hypothetical protein